MTEPPKSGADLAAEIASTNTPGVTLWWLGHCGFAVKSHDMAFYVDPCLGEVPGRRRIAPPPLKPSEIKDADLILCTHKGPSHLHPGTLEEMMRYSTRVRVVLPKSAAEYANSLGLPYSRMTTTDADLRVEYFKLGLYGRVYSVPSAHPELNWTPIGGFPCLGYLLRFGQTTVYHAGDCRYYEGIAERLRPYNVSVALLPINGAPNFDAVEAAQLAEDLGVRWLVPMHYGAFSEQSADVNRFIDHMLGFRPSIGFKVFEPGERWTIPA